LIRDKIYKRKTPMVEILREYNISYPTLFSYLRRAEALDKNRKK